MTFRRPRRRHPITSLKVLVFALATAFQLGQAGAAPSLVQTASRDYGPIDLPNCTVSFPSTNTAGNLIVVAVEVGASAADHPVSVNDTQGNTYYPATDQLTWQNSGGGSSAQIFYAPNIRGGSNTVTMTEYNVGGTGAGNAWNQIAVHEYAGISIAAPLDGSSGITNITGAAPFAMTSPPVTTTINGDLIFAYGNTYNGTLSAGTGFTARVNGVGLSEDRVQTTAGTVTATETNSASTTPYVMFAAAFKPAGAITNGPVLPPQGNRTVFPTTTLTAVNTAAERNTNPVAGSTILFTYTNRAALLADGWNFFATNAGVARNTEVTNPALRALSFDQTNHPGTLRVPCDTGDLLRSSNNTVNSLFRNLSSNWVSVRLAVGFTPAINYQQVNLTLYQDDDNYLKVDFAYNTDLNSEQVVRIITETNGQSSYRFTDTEWYVGGPHLPHVTNMHLRLDRVPYSDNVNAFASVDGADWPYIGTFAQSLVHPRLGIWVGGSLVPYTNGLASCDLQRLEVFTSSPRPKFTYELVSPPAGVGIDLNGVITWTPTMGQSPSTNTITTIVTDDRVPALKATNSFTVVVTQPPPNSAPVLPAQTNRVVNELATLVVTNSATDAEAPPQVLSYSLLSPPAGAGISAGGLITWTPGQTQSPSTNTITTVVTDNGIPPLSATNSFSVMVREVNVASVLPAQANRTNFGQTLLIVTNIASEPNIHSVTVGYGLVNPPAGAGISNGIITWLPSLAQIPSTNVFTTVVTNSNPYDSVNPQLTASNSFTVVALAVPGPGLPAQTNRTVEGLTTLLVTNTATYAGSASRVATNTIIFSYTNRTALLADGWSFIATNAGAARSTEVISTALGPLVDYDQTNHPGVVRIPCDFGDLWLGNNNSRNSLYRDPPVNWLSMKLSVGFNPTTNYHQVHLGLYADDDNYVQVGLSYNAALGGQVVPMVREVGASPMQSVIPGTGITNIYLRMDQNTNNGGVTGLYALDDTNWTTITNYSQPTGNPRLGIWTGASGLFWNSNSPNADLKRLEVSYLSNFPPVMTYVLLNPPAGASISADGVITWTPDQTQSQSTNIFTTVATDNSVPPLSVTNSFTVIVSIPAPELTITSIVASNGIATITWSAIAGETYRLQYIDSLSITNWQDGVPDVTASGPSASTTNSLSGAEQRFYRIMFVPAP